jgi:hypothetical protein
MEECLTNVIKLSRTTCECFDENKPEEFADGKFDIYLDELEGMNLKMVSGAEGCEEGGIWDILDKARENATKQFKADLLSCLNTNYINRRESYSGVVGKTTFTGSLSLTKSTIGWKVKFNPIDGGYMTIKRIAIGINTTQSVTVSVFDNNEYADTPLGVYTINAVANVLTYATLATPLELPMWSTSGKRLEYYFVYDRGSAQPKDMKVDCNCGGIKPAWTQWIAVNGIQGNNTDYATFTSDNYANGLILDIAFSCKAISIICNEHKPLSEDNGYDLQIAYAIRWKAGELVWEKILSSQNINRYTLMDREALYGKRNHARKLYGEFIAYLCENVPAQKYGCLTCRPNNNFHKSNALA